MKRYIFLVVAVALATVSCSKTYDTNKNAGEGTAITIGSWTNTLTRARDVGGNEFAGGDKFFVYAYTPTTATQFDGTVVSTEDGNTWTYSPVRYWNRDNAYYDFYAISPSEDVAESAIVNDHTLSTGVFESKALTLAGNDNDILVADKKHVLKANYGHDVQLNFRHINALFDLKVRKGNSIGDGVLKITAVSLENIKNAGKFDVTGYSEAPADPVDVALVTWTPSGSGSYTGANGVKHTVDTDIIGPTTAVTTAGNQYLINNLVVMPQTFVASAQQLKISYTITTGTGGDAQTNTFTNKTYDLILFDKTDYDANNGTDPDAQNANPRVSGWAAGVHYIYTITIDAEAINFTATMEDWGTDNGYYYILN